MSNPTCPNCNLPLAEHPAGACLDRWMAKFMPPIQTRVKDAFGNILRLRDKEPLRPYSTSLDAMAEVEREIKRRDLTSEYLEKLCDLTISLAHRVCSEAPSCDWCVRTATALQCCKAAIAVLEAAKEIK